MSVQSHDVGGRTAEDDDDDDEEEKSSTSLEARESETKRRLESETGDKCETRDERPIFKLEGLIRHLHKAFKSRLLS